MAMLSRSAFLVLAAALCAAAIPAQQATPAPKPAVCGRVDVHDGLRILHTWGTPRERGFAHGSLLGKDVAALVTKEFAARFGRKEGMLTMARTALPRWIAYPEAVREEIAGLFDGVVQSGADRRIPQLEREFDLDDLLVANALDVFGLMGCSGFTLHGEQVLGGLHHAAVGGGVDDHAAVADTTQAEAMDRLANVRQLAIDAALQGDLDHGGAHVRYSSSSLGPAWRQVLTEDVLDRLATLGSNLARRLDAL